MKEKITRRQAIKTVTVGTTVVTVPSMATVVSGETDSDEVEVEATATIPTDTSVEIEIFEDTSGNDESDRSQSKSLSDDTETYVYDELESNIDEDNQLWAEITLSQDTDGEETPELESITITLPENTGTTEPSGGREKTQEGDGPLIFRIFDRFYPFIVAVVLAVTALGISSKSMAIASLAGYITFSYFAITTGDTLLTNILIVTAVVIFIGFGFKFWRLEGMGE